MISKHVGLGFKKNHIINACMVQCVVQFPKMCTKVSSLDNFYIMLSGLKLNCMLPLDVTLAKWLIKEVNYSHELIAKISVTHVYHHKLK